jgi:hypothetical protein
MTHKAKTSRCAALDNACFSPSIRTAVTCRTYVSMWAIRDLAFGLAPSTPAAPSLAVPTFPSRRFRRRQEQACDLEVNGAGRRGMIETKRRAGCVRAWVCVGTGSRIVEICDLEFIKRRRKLPANAGKISPDQSGSGPAATPHVGRIWLRHPHPLSGSRQPEARTSQRSDCHWRAGLGACRIR